MTAEKFDDQASHGLYYMKAVDFIVEEDNFMAFIEIKDLENPSAPEANRIRDRERFLSEKLDSDLYYKYRDTFLYQWACNRPDKPICYWVIIALSELTKVQLTTRTRRLQEKLPLEGPPSGIWNRPIVKECMVYNIETWKQHHPDILLDRIPRRR